MKNFYWKQQYKKQQKCARIAEVYEINKDRIYIASEEGENAGWQLDSKGLNTYICQHDLWISLARI